MYTELYSFVHSYYSFPTKPPAFQLPQLKHTQGPAETLGLLATIAYVLPCILFAFVYDVYISGVLNCVSKP